MLVTFDYFFIYFDLFIYVLLNHIDTVFLLCHEVCWDKFRERDVGEL
jgi:hypothetical protein